MTTKEMLAELESMWRSLPELMGDEWPKLEPLVRALMGQLRAASGDEERAAVGDRLLLLFEPYPAVRERLGGALESVSLSSGIARGNRRSEPVVVEAPSAPPPVTPEPEEPAGVVPDQPADPEGVAAATSTSAPAEPTSPVAVPSPRTARPRPPSTRRAPSWTEALGGFIRRRRERRAAASATSPAPEPVPPATAGAPDEEGAADPPRSAFARLDCPDVVIVAREFELAVGLSERASPDVVGEELTRPPSSLGPYTLAIQVVADGFRLREGESWRVELPVTARSPYPSAVLHLTPEAGPDPVKARAIRAMFSVDAQTMGLAFRSVVVAGSEAQLADATGAPQDAGVDLSIPTAWTAPDLTVRILRGESESDGRLLWTFETPHPGIDLPDEPVGSDVGDDPRAFARQLVDKVNVREGQPGLYQYLVGVGRTIAEELPEEFLAGLRAVAEATGGRPPTVLILSEEPHVPWELAAVEPPLDPGAPPFLSAQAEVGRWVLGRKRPPLPPPEDAAAGVMAVISGVYDRPGWARLVQAEEEAAGLRDAYGAVTVNAAAPDVLACLAGSPTADVMHFAVHGIYDPNGVQDGLILVDGHALDPMEVKGSIFSSTPFVFLNACQVGSGNKVLGDYAGLAEAFLWAGACGVVAPLWSVKDTIAKEIALRFYERTFTGAPVGTVLRKERAAFSPAEGPPSATYLAYQYFGHPAMRLNRTTK